jgi:cyclophilin family peptidyl-prolyl cis-trans isomerase/HEAT repeat protein
MSAWKISRSSRGLVAGALVVAAACRGPAGPGAAAEPGRTSSVPGPEPGQDPLATIARHEEALSDGDGLLETFLARGAEPTRERAAVALGRLPYPEQGAEVTRALAGALQDESIRVRAAAAFALGMRGDPAAADALLAARGEADDGVRARIVEAASRIDDPRLRAFVLESLADRAAGVRAEAAIGPHRWPKDAPDAAAVDAALLEALRKAEPDGETAWRALFTLARRASAAARAGFVAGLASTDARARIFSAQGLRPLPAEPASRDGLRAALGDEDWRVVCEAALALGEHPEPEALPELARAMENRSAHVRRAAAEALGGFAASRDRVRPLLERARVDESVNVRGAALVSQARLFGSEMAPEVGAIADRSDPWLRAGAAAAAAKLPDETAVPILLRMTHDPNLRVADAAARGLKDHATPEARARIAELLADVDNGLRLAAAEALKEIGGPDDLDSLGRCLSSSRGDISAEIAANVVDAAARIGGDRARAVLESGAAHPDPFVRRKSRELLAKRFPDASLPATEPRGEEASPVPIPGIDYSPSATNPRVEIVTSRGAMVFELFRDEAPVHVYNFLELVQRGSYDGLAFHRVVPDFVIQGGDPRGDGNGGNTWRGTPLRREFTPRKFVRGSLGMPRNDDPDSGGSQIFVCHRETPHLDGRYTLFGELREGSDVLDAIEVGDTIRSVRVLPAAVVR